MTRTIRHFLRPALLAAALLTSVAAAGVPGLARRLDDRLIVGTAPGAAVGDFIAAFTANHPEIALAPLETIPGRPVHLLSITLPRGTTEAEIDALELDLETGYPALLAYGEFLYDNHAPEGHTGSTYVDGISESAYQGQYLRGRIGLDAAHARTTGLGPVIALLDTGLDAAHPALAGRVLPWGASMVPGAPGIADVASGADGDGDGIPDEMVGHGTYVAGLVALVAPDARLLPVRVLDADGVGDAWWMTKGLYYAIDRGVEVINASLGSTYAAQSVEDAIDEAEALGIVVVSAAGNLDRSEPREFPAMGCGLGVAAVDSTDRKADFSNFSDRLFIAAPGAAGPDGAIVSTLPGGGYGTWAGTSFSAPLVAGAAALVRAQHPEWEPDPVTGGLWIAELIEDTLAATAFDLYPMNPEHADEEELGAGRLDASSAAAAGPIAPARLGDLDGDGLVGFDDLVRLLDAWGRTHASADLDGDGDVGFGDLLVLLGGWG